MDIELEALIDRAGRSAVYAAASANGWTTWNAPPRWVWRQLAEEIIRRNGTKTDPANTLQTGPFTNPQRAD
jgi:hypothetical protein